MGSSQLAGKTAIITGGGRGLGRAMALELAWAGANVMVTAARARHELEAVADEAAKSQGTGLVRAVLGDVTKEADCQRVMSEALCEFGAVHILVNNASRGMRFVSESFFEIPKQF